MGWVVPIAMAAASVYNSTQQADAAGKGGVAAGTPTYAAQNMPPWMVDRVHQQVQSMPANMNIGWGGQQFPTTYGPSNRAMDRATQLYNPAGVIPTDYPPSALTGAMSAAAPYMWQWAMQPNQGVPNASTVAPPAYSSMPIAYQGGDYNTTLPGNYPTGGWHA